MATVAEATGPAIEAGLGPIGIAIAAIGFLLPLLLTHLETGVGRDQGRGERRSARHRIGAARDRKSVRRGGRVRHIPLETRLPPPLLVVTGPIGIVVALFLNFHKQIAKVFADVIGIFERFGSTVLAVLKAVPGLMERAGKDIALGLLKGLGVCHPALSGY